MWTHNNETFEKLSEIRKYYHYSSTKMQWLLKNNHIKLIDNSTINLERLPNEREEITL